MLDTARKQVFIADLVAETRDRRLVLVVVYHSTRRRHQWQAMEEYARGLGRACRETYLIAPVVALINCHARAGIVGAFIDPLG